jgi:hypothetical protein
MALASWFLCQQAAFTRVFLKIICLSFKGMCFMQTGTFFSVIIGIRVRLMGKGCLLSRMGPRLWVFGKMMSLMGKWSKIGVRNR